MSSEKNKHRRKKVIRDKNGISENRKILNIYYYIERISILDR